MSKYIATGLFCVAIIIAGIIVAASVTASSDSAEANEPTTTESTTDSGSEIADTTETEEVSISTVESAFAVSLGHRQDKITEGKPNMSMTTDKVDCQRTSEGEAVCYVTVTASVGGYEETKHYAWNVTYDLEDGHPLAYQSR